MNVLTRNPNDSIPIPSSFETLAELMAIFLIYEDQITHFYLIKIEYLLF